MDPIKRSNESDQEIQWIRSKDPMDPIKRSNGRIRSRDPMDLIKRSDGSDQETQWIRSKDPIIRIIRKTFFINKFETVKNGLNKK